MEEGVAKRVTDTEVLAGDDAQLEAAGGGSAPPPAGPSRARANESECAREVGGALKRRSRPPSSRFRFGRGRGGRVWVRLRVDSSVWRPAWPSR